jgi:hypothetical protein
VPFDPPERGEIQKPRVRARRKPERLNLFFDDVEGDDQK